MPGLTVCFDIEDRSRAAAPLPESSRTRLEAFFGAPLDTVTVTTSIAPRELGARGFAAGGMRELMVGKVLFRAAQVRARQLLSSILAHSPIVRLYLAGK